MTTKLLPCTCTHQYQDLVYHGLRIHNRIDGKSNAWRCVVCGKETEMPVRAPIRAPIRKEGGDD